MLVYFNSHNGYIFGQVCTLLHAFLGQFQACTTSDLPAVELVVAVSFHVLRYLQNKSKIKCEKGKGLESYLLCVSSAGMDIATSLPIA